jgi:Zn-dependent protease
LASGGKMAFGWAKPVPVNFAALRNPKKDMFWVAAAGPGANLIMAIGWALIFKLTLIMPEHYFSSPLLEMAKVGILINLVLMVLNLMPVPPLDGGRIAISVLPHALAYHLAKLEPYGLLVIMLLMASGVLSSIMYPILGSIIGLLSFVFGI